MATSSDEPGELPHFRQIISRDGSEWVVRLLGPFLPTDGVTARTATLADIHGAAMRLYPFEELHRAEGSNSAGWSTDTAYDLGPGLDAEREAFSQASMARYTAERD